MKRIYWKIWTIIAFTLMCYHFAFFFITFEFEEYVTISKGGRIEYHKDWKKFSPLDLIAGIFWLCTLIWNLFELSKKEICRLTGLRV